MSTRSPGTEPLADLLQALSDERAALLEARPERLPEIAARKQRLLGECAALAGRCGPRLLPSLVAQLRRARELNDANAILLAPQLNSVRARLEALTGATRTVYGADGRSASPFGTPRRHIAA